MKTVLIFSSFLWILTAILCIINPDNSIGVKIIISFAVAMIIAQAIVINRMAEERKCLFNT